MTLLKRPSARFLVTLSITLVMLSLHFAGALIGLLPDSHAIKRDARASLAEVLTVRSVRHLADSDIGVLDETLQLVVERNEDVLSAAVRRADGDELVMVGEHNRYWDRAERSFSTDSQLTVPIMENGRRWGQLELRFEPLRRAGWRGWLDRPLTRYGIFLGIIGFFVLYFVLGKMLRHLDPSKAVPSRVRSALDTMMEGLIAIDLKGHVVLANQAFAAVAGRTPEALLGSKIDRMPWQRAAHEQDQELPWVTTVRDGHAFTNAPIHFIDGDGKRRTFLVNCSPVMGGEGKHVGVLVGLGDVTQLEEKEIELRLSKDRAEAANRAKSEFLANMSHEIRTPMNAILGFTEMLRRGYARTENDNKKYLNTIHTSGTFLLELINDLLDLSKIEAGSLELELAPCAVHEVTREVINVLSGKAAERDIALEMDVHDPLPATINTDRTRLRQILTNLVGNAIKFTECGSVQIGLRYDPQNEPGMLAFDITDTGIGMNEEQIEKIFNPFVQADRSITRRFGGTGLGLSISRRFALALGGEIEVTSQPDKGSTFTVRIAAGCLDGVPMLSVEDALRHNDEAEKQSISSWSFPEARILVADDNKQNRDLLRLVLSEHGLLITEAENGKEAVEAVREEGFDLILMDIEMPIMDGAAATKALRSDGVDVPIIALTAHALDGISETIKAAGFSDYFSKPVDINMLLDHLAKLLGATETSGDIDGGASPDEPIFSRLPVDDPRYREIVADFARDLDARLIDMQSVCDEGDFDEIARYAHSLQGLGGTVGFTEFTAPARALEKAALAGAAQDVDRHLAVIRSLASRICVDVQASPRTHGPTATVASLGESEPIRSRLPVADSRYRAIVVDFIDDLASRLAAMEQALSDADFDALAACAHGLKGVAGGVGFDELTAPTRQLETAARDEDKRDAAAALATLRALAARIERPAPQEEMRAAGG